MLSIHDNQGVDTYARSLGLDLHVIRLLRNDFYKKFLPDKQAVERLPELERSAFRASVSLHPLCVRERRDSSEDDATKLALATADGHCIECVLMRPSSARVSVCVSSQIGCGGGCLFCATGRMGFVRQLSAAEILDQVLHAGQLAASAGQRIRNVVFMGMGEPLCNEQSVGEALEVLTSPRCFDLSARRMMISTVGVPDAMVRFARRFPSVRLAVSLHSARQAVREQLMPLARHHPLDRLRSAIRTVADIQGQDIMLEVLLLRGVTDTDEDAMALCEFVEGLPVWVNFIEYNPVPGLTEYQPASPDVLARFMAALKERGILVMARRSLGRDIGAACGQLAGESGGKGCVNGEW